VSGAANEANRAPHEVALLPEEVADALEILFLEARSLGFLGPGPVQDQIGRSMAFFISLPVAPCLAIDLGSGGGLPALVLALAWPASRWLLVESNRKRASWLGLATARIDVAGRCEVVCERAEVLGRGAARQSADLVTARSFAPPGPTAECAAPLLRVGGTLLVAEPPVTSGTGPWPEGAEGAWPEGGEGRRWPAAKLAQLGLRLDATNTVSTASGPTSISRLISIAECPATFPRGVGVPFKRHLF
jgi:16S rRNA (guanine527-N7)-methyltransferase